MNIERYFPLVFAGSLLSFALAACSSDEPRRTSDDDDDGGGGSSTSSSTTGGTSSGGMDPEPEPMKGITAAHNVARASVDPPAASPLPPLSWSPAVAAAAQAHAEKCIYEKSANGYGENILAAAVPLAPQEVVGFWVAEGDNYTYASNACSGICDQYLQVVWAKSLNLGCAAVPCTGNSPFGGDGSWVFWICNYDPPSNPSGEKPY